MEGGGRIRQRKKFNCNEDAKHFLANCAMASKKIGYKIENSYWLPEKFLFLSMLLNSKERHNTILKK